LSAVDVVGLFGLIVGCFVGLAGVLSGRDKKIADNFEWHGVVNTKLDSISDIVKENSVDVKGIQATVTDHCERLSAVEESAKSAHHRIDEMKRN
jgi:hypothetical protein